MAKTRDDFLKPVVDVLAKRAAFICANPDCRALTVAPSEEDETKFLYIGKAAHISAAAKHGPRYEPSMSSEERKSASNGIFLCSNCADMIDKNNGLDFPVDQLREWKNEHEKWVGANLNKQQLKAPHPSAVAFNVTSAEGGITAGVLHMPITLIVGTDALQKIEERAQSSHIPEEEFLQNYLLLDLQRRLEDLEKEQRKTRP